MTQFGRLIYLIDKRKVLSLGDTKTVGNDHASRALDRMGDEGTVGQRQAVIVTGRVRWVWEATFGRAQKAASATLVDVTFRASQNSRTDREQTSRVDTTIDVEARIGLIDGEHCSRGRTLVVTRGRSGNGFTQFGQRVVQQWCRAV